MLLAFSWCSADYGGKEIGPSVNIRLFLRFVTSSFRIVSLELSRITTARITKKTKNHIEKQEIEGKVER